MAFVSYHAMGRKIETFVFVSISQNTELILTEGTYQMISKGQEEVTPFHISTMGIYLVIEANNSLILMWDKRTSIFIKLSPDFKVADRHSKVL